MNKKILIMIIIPVLLFTGCGKKGKNNKVNQQQSEQVKKISTYRVKIKSDMDTEELTEVLSKYLKDKNAKLEKIVYDTKDIYIVRYKSVDKVIKGGQKFYKNPEKAENKGVISTYEATVEVNYGEKELEKELKEKFKNGKGELVSINKIKSEDGINTFKVKYKSETDLLSEGAILGDEKATVNTEEVLEQDGRVIFYIDSTRNLSDLKKIMKDLDLENNVFKDSFVEEFEKKSDIRTKYKISFDGTKSDYDNINKAFFNYIEDKEIKILNLDTTTMSDDELEVSDDTVINVIKNSEKEFKVEVVDIINPIEHNITLFYKGMNFTEIKLNKLSELINEKAIEEYNNQLEVVVDKYEPQNYLEKNDLKIISKKGKTRMYFKSDIKEQKDIKNRFEKIKSIIGREDFSVTLYQNKNNKEEYVLENSNEKDAENIFRNISPMLIRYLTEENVNLYEVVNGTVGTGFGDYDNFIEKYEEDIIGTIKTHESDSKTYILTDKEIEFDEKEDEFEEISEE